jgi:hypothetical protein
MDTTRAIFLAWATPEKEISHGQMRGDGKPNTTEFGAFAESEVSLGEGAFPLIEGFTERKLSAKASQCCCNGEGVFAKSKRGPLSTDMHRESKLAFGEDNFMKQNKKKSQAHRPTGSPP